MAIHLTRESWLNAAVDALRAGVFADIRETVPVVRVSVGFPGGGSARKRIGEYWPKAASSDEIPQVFISPVLKTPLQHLDVLVHELVHSIVPMDGHKKRFKLIATSVGLTGKMTATIAGPHLTERLNALAADLGEFPHGALSLANRKKQGTRLNKVSCDTCGYTARVTAKWIDSGGAPICPCNNETMTVDGSEETEGE